ncbi:hypothetical protein B4U80_05382 [Leptotrombidium deliense]|uniref:Uncharacterized protein n=1 Tax=Leptotrombidium deliense TaxID=299467 RepID=A0A443SFY0_9ACAR|nr:hypothetical protein B4U80_05382 [Leptotrombidium deliense]
MSYMLLCLECGGNYTEEEMELALLIVGCILTCYSRIMWECSEDHSLIETMKYMPPPVYNKSSNAA